MERSMGNLEETTDEIGVDGKRQAAILARFKSTKSTMSTMRKKRAVVWNQLIAELKRLKPDRKKLYAQIDTINKQMGPFLDEVIKVSLWSIGKLKGDERVKLARRWKDKKREPVTENFLVRRFVDSFLSDLNATKAQRKVFMREKKTLLVWVNKVGAANRKRQLRLAAVLAKKKAPPEKMVRAEIKGARAEFVALARGAADGILRFGATLDKQQRWELNKKMVGAEICKK